MEFIASPRTPAGLATLPDDTEIVYIGLSVLIVAAALATNPHNRISVDGLLKRNK